MNDPPSPLWEPQDELLADIAIRVQLNRTDYGKAENRYEAVRTYIERDGSRLRDKVARFYPQGSMAIGAAIASGTSDDKFDVDVVAELVLSPTATAREVLDDLYWSIKGEPGSRYFEKAERRSRCVTIHYADDMHLDVTPARRSPGTREREGNIFHHHEASFVEKSLVANPYGFAVWFKETCREDLAFAEAYAARDYDYRRTLAEAEVEPLPGPPHLWTSPKTVALQLLKRWRNIEYDGHSGRVPPSVLLSKLVAEAQIVAPGLSGTLFDAAKHILRVLDEAEKVERLVCEENPVCPEDDLTDRWPENRRGQRELRRRLRVLVAALSEFRATDDIGRMGDILAPLFGEQVSGAVVKRYFDSRTDAVRDGVARHDRRRGQIIVPSAGAAASARPGRATPRQTFYGG